MLPPPPPPSSPPPPLLLPLPPAPPHPPPPPANAVQAESKRPVPQSVTSHSKKRSARQDGFKSTTTIDSSDEDAVPPKKKSKTEKGKQQKEADMEEEIDELEDSEEEPEVRKQEKKSKGKGKVRARDAGSESEPSKLGLVVWVSKAPSFSFSTASNHLYRIPLASGARPSPTCAAAHSAHPTRYATSATVRRSAAPAARSMASRCPPSTNSLSAARSRSPNRRHRIPDPSPPIPKSPRRPSLRLKPSLPWIAASNSRRKSSPWSAPSRVSLPASTTSAPSQQLSPT